MKLCRSRIFLCDGANLENIIDFLRESRCSLEVFTFAAPENLDSGFDDKLEKYKESIKNIPDLKVSLHGPFFDLPVNSPDSEIMEITERRYRMGIKAALKLGADKINFHTQFNPMLRLEAYNRAWSDSSFKLFTRLLEESEGTGINVLIENMFEDSPEYMKKLLEKINSPRMGICLDSAHIQVYAEADYERWIGELAPWIKYMHLSDTGGRVDDHLPLGRGVIDFGKIFRILEEKNLEIDFCLENWSVEDLKISLDHLESLPEVDLEAIQ